MESLSLHSSCPQPPFLFIGHFMMSCIYNFVKCGLSSNINITLLAAPYGLIEQILFHWLEVVCITWFCLRFVSVNPGYNSSSHCFNSQCLILPHQPLKGSPPSNQTPRGTSAANLGDYRHCCCNFLNCKCFFLVISFNCVKLPNCNGSCMQKYCWKFNLHANLPTCHPLLWSVNVVTQCCTHGLPGFSTRHCDCNHLNALSCIAAQTFPFRFTTHRLVLVHVYFQKHTLSIGSYL